VELDEIRETLLRRELDETETNRMGEFVKGSQGALRFEVQGIVGGEPRIIVEHITRIHPSCAPDWPRPPDGGDGAHKVIIEGRPRIEFNVEATDEGGNRAAGLEDGGAFLGLQAFSLSGWNAPRLTKQGGELVLNPAQVGGSGRPVRGLW
jgi:hypothetical protein